MKPNLKLVPRKKKHPIDWLNVTAWVGGIMLSAVLWWAIIFFWAPQLTSAR